MIFGSLLKGLYLNPKYAKKVKKEDVEKSNIKKPSLNLNKQDDENFGTSLLVSASTNSVIPGLIVGGSLAGALVGSSLASSILSEPTNCIDTSDTNSSPVESSNDTSNYDYDTGTSDFDWD